MFVDVLVDVQFGDCGKGKISKALDEQNDYDAICKYNGGSNAGHAVWVGDKKYTAHHLTSGIYSDALIVIGPGCVLNPTKFLKELEDFGQFGVEGRVWIHPAAHVVTADHIREEESESKIGTTRQGIGPAYSDKYRRTGIRAENVEELRPYLMPRSQTTKFNQQRILMEGSQGFWLDIDHGNYPYVTSSHIHPAFAFTSFGMPMKLLRNVYGVGKVYETYVGESDDIVFGDPEFVKRIQEVGHEYGETTGRLRKVGYLNLDRLVTACEMCGVDHLYLNKFDVFTEVGNELGRFPVVYNHLDHHLKSAEEFRQFVTAHLRRELPDMMVTFSGNKHGI